ncbi:MAG: ATP-dependent DNA ligase [Firmicutes bacterium]|nr:ATP-dependent DNA ligase [Bacillota bacterium]
MCAAEIDPVSGPVPPMLATPVEKPFDSPDYAFELKWDGYRAIAFVGARDGRGVTLQSRNLRDITSEFPGLAGIHRRISGGRATLDGEIVVMKGGRPSFQALQHREEPPVYVAFDILSLNGKSLLEQPFGERRRVLEDSVQPGGDIILSSTFEREGVRLYETASERGLEGIVAKRLDSPYVPGRRSSYWLKIKARRAADCVIGGINRGVGTPVGSLAVGLYDGDELIYVGSVGAGLTDAVRLDLLSRLKAAEAPPFSFGRRGIPREVRGAFWVGPDTVCEVGYAEMTKDLRLRQPSYLRLREDKHPRECDFVQIFPDRPAER